ncbi:sigma-70 family RNA polymerase sigma factor [Candidatus Pacearchaeota archaeon]|nr:sigma-70 family RNA polymerase sigma factor [Candidatus Pacearchaeota archaeon]
MDLDEKSRILMNELAKDFSKRGDIFRIFLGMANRKLKVDEFEDTLQDMVVSIGKGGHTYEHEVHEGIELNQRPVLPWLLSCWSYQIIATIRKRERTIPKIKRCKRGKLVQIDGDLSKRLDTESVYRISCSRFEEREEFNDEITYLKLYPVLDELAPEQREFIDLHYFQGLELKEIALKTGLKESTIRGRLYEARKTLREILPYSIVNKRGKIREAA